MRIRKLHSLVIVAFAGLSFVAQVSAQPYVMGFSGAQPETLTVNGGAVTLSTAQSEINSGTFNQGWWSATLPNAQGNGNTATGVVGSDSLNSYYIFDLNALAGVAVTSATLSLSDPADLGAATFNLSFFDVTTPATTLVNYPTPTSAAIYNDLGSGVEYGSLAYTPNGSGLITVNLDAAALAEINADENGNANGAPSYFAIGGTLNPSSTVPDGGTTLGLFGMCASCLLGLKRKMK